MVVVVQEKHGTKKLFIFLNRLEQSPQFIVVKMFAKLATVEETNLSPK